MDGEVRAEEIAVPLRFVVTVDTEADDAWSRPDSVELENIKEIDRFQELCLQYSVVPTYLLSYECATRDEALAIPTPVIPVPMSRKIPLILSSVAA